MAQAIKENRKEKIEIVDQPDEITESGKSLPAFIVPVVLLLTVLGVFFLLSRRIFSASEKE